MVRLTVSALVAGSVLILAGSAWAAAAPRLRVGPLVPSGRVGRSTVTSSNWSGYAATGSTFTDVKGSWVEPSVTCSSRRSQYASFWVGLDGYSSSTVEQIGSDSDCNGRNQPSYYAWYEMYPSNSVEIPLSVAAGDTLSAEVSFTGTNTYTLTINDSRTGGTYTTTQTLSGAARSSAEWIAESPEICSVACSLASLPDFGTVGFGGASATGIGLTGSISAFTNDSIVMETSNSVVRAEPSALRAGGSAFTDTWEHS